MVNYKDDLKINPETLEVEWLRQAELFGKYSEMHASAVRRMNQLEQKLKVIRSDLLMKARESGAKNAAQEEAYYRTSQIHQEAKAEFIEAQYEADVLDGAVFAFHQRKAALENLVKLASMNYFATPETPRSLGAVADAIRNAERSGTAEAILARRTGRRTAGGREETR